MSSDVVVSRGGAAGAINGGLAARLATILRGDQVDVSVSGRDLHGRGESWDDVRLPDVVVYPESTEDVRRVMVFAHEHGVSVTPVAVNSSLGGHTVPVAGGISLDVGRMDRILEIDAEDFLAVVQPAVTYPRLNQALKATGLFFPVDPGAEASLGGMASTNASGTLAVRYGVTRDRVLGLEVVTPMGRVIHTGGRAPKSSSGYSLTQLYCGAEGTLGVITELTVRLVARPERVMGARVAFADIPAAVGYVAELIRSGVPVARCELVDAAALRAIRQHLGLDLPAMPTVFLEFHGELASVRDATETALALAGEHSAAAAEVATEPAALEALWRARHQAYAAAVAVHPGMVDVITDVAVPVSRLAEVMEVALASVARLGVPSILIGHAGDGNFHLVLFFPPDDAEVRRQVEVAYDELVRAALAAGGTCTGEHGVGLRKLPYVRAEHGEAVDVMWAIKDALDPAGIMNPGKKLPPRTA